MENNKSIEKIPVRFKRFSFPSKCAYCSCKTRTLFSDWINGKSWEHAPLPWDMSKFTMLAMLDGEYQYEIMDEKAAYRMLSQMNGIWQEISNQDNMDKILPHLIFEEQIKYQRNVFLLYERYFYFFQFDRARLSMPLEIKNKLGVTSEVVLELLFRCVLLATDDHEFFDFIKKIADNREKKFSGEGCRLIEALSLSREEFSRRQRESLKTVGNVDVNWLAATNLLEMYPCITELGKTYLPNLYFLFFALTDRMLNRLTKGDNNLRSLIGKEVLEQYVYDILQRSGCYSVITKEKQYKVNGKESLSPDICIEKDGEVLFLELKLNHPSQELKKLNSCDHASLIERYVDYIVKFIQHIREREKYLLTTYAARDVYALLVLFEDSMIFRSQILEQVKSHLDFKDVDSSWIYSNMHIVGLYEIEKLAYGSIDIFPLLRKWSHMENNWNDYSIPHEGRFAWKFQTKESICANPQNAFRHLFAKERVKQ